MQFGGLNLASGVGGGPPPPTSVAASVAGSFNLPNVLGNLVSGPNSPNRAAAVAAAAAAGAAGPLGPAAAAPGGGSVGAIGSQPGAGGSTLPDHSAGGGSPSPFGGMLGPPPGPAQSQAALSLATSAASGVITTSSAGGPPLPPVSSAAAGAPGGGSSSAAATAAAASGGMQSGIEQIRTGNISQIFPDIVGPIPREVEDEANSYFQRIYNHPPHPTMSINEVLDLLKNFQESQVKRERDVFNCMIKNLFEEYKYFPQYPEKELNITAQLFGGIIERGLVNMVPLGLALRFVLDAVRKPPDSNMYFFGITALDRFKVRLKDYPQYCQHISCIEHFKEHFPAFLVKWVEYGMQSQLPPGDPPTGEAGQRIVQK